MTSASRSCLSSFCLDPPGRAFVGADGPTPPGPVRHRLPALHPQHGADGSQRRSRTAADDGHRPSTTPRGRSPCATPPRQAATGVPLMEEGLGSYPHRQKVKCSAKGDDVLLGGLWLHGVPRHAKPLKSSASMALRPTVVKRSLCQAAGYGADSCPWPGKSAKCVTLEEGWHHGWALVLRSLSR